MSSGDDLPTRSLEGRLTIRLEVLPGDTVRERLENAKAFGFDGIAFPGRFKERFLPELQQLLSDLPLPIATISLGFTGSLISPDPNVRRRCRDSLLRLFDLCHELQARSVNMPPELIQDNPDRLTHVGPFESLSAARDELLAQQLPALGDAARDRGIQLLIEPVNGYETEYLTTLSQAVSVCERVNHPAIGLTADFYHMMLEELDASQSVLEAGPWIRHVHVAENTRVEPGPGSLDLQPGFQALHRIDYQGLVEVECRHLSGPAHDCLPKSAHYLREQWDRAAAGVQS